MAIVKLHGTKTPLIYTMIISKALSISVFNVFKPLLITSITKKARKTYFSLVLLILILIYCRAK